MKKLISRTLLLIAGMLFAFSASAQDLTATGNVTDAADGSPIPGVNVMVKGTTNGTITDFDGKFQIKCNQGDVLVFSFIGYKVVEQPAAQGMQVVLGTDDQTLDDVVVIGYGVAKKNDLTGSVTALKPDEQNKGLVTNAQDMLQGKVAGVNIQTTGGEPGGEAKIRIRGGSSLNASNDPLIVIDGLAMDNNGIEGISNPLALVNPADIESFTVLKDASATAIYGSRASNGVIIITTKKGRANQKPQFIYNGNVSVSKVKETVDVLSGSEYVDLIKEKLKDKYATDEEWLASEEYMSLGYRNADGEHVFANTDWQDEIMRVAVSTDHNITMQGGLKNMPYRLSYGFTNQNGILNDSQFRRHTISLNVSPSFLEDHLKVTLNAKGMFANTTYAYNSIGSAITMDPTKPVKGAGTWDEEIFNSQFGGYYQYFQASDRKDSYYNYDRMALATYNPVAMQKLFSSKGKSKSLLGNLEIDYKIHGLEDLHLHVNGGLNVSTGEKEEIKKPEHTDNYYFGRYGFYTKDTYNLSLNAYAQYLKDFADIHSVNVMAGYEWQHFHIKTDKDEHGNYPMTNEETDDSGNPLAGTIYQPAENTLYKSENFLVSFFGRLNYTLMDRYMLTFTLRADGSSRFSKDNRWGMFPSAAFAWRAKEEGFLKDVDVVSDLKVRLGYGVTGQQEGIGDYTYFASYTPNANGAYYDVAGNGGVTYRPDAYNKNLTWERTTTFNVGLDLGLLDQRIVVNADYYYRKTDDLINTVYVPCGSNFAPQVTSNIGSLHNKGIELGITAHPVNNDNFHWELGFNYTRNINEIDELIDSQDDNYSIPQGGKPAVGVGSDQIKAYTVGKSTSVYHVYQQVYGQDGKPLEGVFVDRNADGVINAADRYYYKKSDPDFQLGFTSKFTFLKNWDFGFALRANIGNYNYNSVEASGANVSYSNISSGGSWHNVMSENLKNNWQTIDGLSALSDYFVQNASFLKCDNMTLGYSFPTLFGAKISGRVYVSAQNVFTITKYKGLDPEIEGGRDSNIYPRPFVGMFGVNLNF